MQFFGGRLEKVWPQEFAWGSGILYNQESFNLDDRRKKKEFTKDWLAQLGGATKYTDCISAEG